MEGKKDSRLDVNAQKYDGPSWDAFNRLQRESESLRQQLDDERQCGDDLERCRKNINEIQKQLDNERQLRIDSKRMSRKLVDELQNELDALAEKKDNLEWENTNLKSKLRRTQHETRLKQVLEELDDAEDANRNLRENLRDLRKKTEKIRK